MLSSPWLVSESMALSANCPSFNQSMRQEQSSLGAISHHI